MALAMTGTMMKKRIEESGAEHTAEMTAIDIGGAALAQHK